MSVEFFNLFPPPIGSSIPTTPIFMKELKPYFEAVQGIPHFKDEMPPMTHRAVEILIADGKLVAQQTLDGRELIIGEPRKNQGEIAKVERQTP